MLSRFSIYDLFNDLPDIDVVDVGASPIDGEPPYQPLVKSGKAFVIGFEPSPEQYHEVKKLETERLRFFPYALGDGKEHELKICRCPGMTSLFEPDFELLNHFRGFPDWAEVLERINVETRRLDDIEEIDTIDYLKLDVQGSELSILQNARKKLESALVIHVEVQLIPFYENQPLFAEIDHFLRKMGFYLHRFLPLVSRTFSAFDLNQDVYAGLSQVLWTDAVYVRKFTSFSELKTDELLKIAAITHDLYASYDLCALALDYVDRIENSDRKHCYFKRLRGEPSDLSYLFKEAVDLWNTGNFKDAIRYCLQLAENDDCPIEIHLMMGEYAIQTDDYSGAAISFQKALNSDNESFQANVGLLRALGIAEKSSDAMLQLSNLRKSNPELSSLIEELLELNDSDDFEYAFSCYNNGEYELANEICCRILNLNPEDYNALKLLGTLELVKNNFFDAIKSLKKSLELHDSDPALHISLGLAYKGLKRFEDAEQCFQNALQLDPQNATAYNNLAELLIEMKRYTEAEIPCRKAIDIKTDYPEAYNNLGIIMSAAGKSIPAESAYKRALALRPDFLEPYVNIAILMKNLKRYDEAEGFYKRAFKFDPKSDELLYNFSLLELLLARYESGFKCYEHRPDRGDVFAWINGVIRPWQGETLQGKSLLLVSEQGHGDSLMMMRYTEILKNQMGSGNLGACCALPLHRVFALSIGVDVVISDTERPVQGQFDYFCPVMSLPHILKTTLNSIPASTPYIKVPCKMKSLWAKRLQGVSGIKVGLVWAGSSALVADAKRSIALSEFVPLLGVQGVTFFSLQKEDTSEQLKTLGLDIINLMDNCDDFLDTAALVDNLDLVIAVDTAVAHLAGALAKPVWLLCRYESEWRWMHDRKDSLWYPTMTIFRQSSPDDWGRVLLEVVGRLNVLGDNHNYYE